MESLRAPDQESAERPGALLESGWGSRASAYTMGPEPCHCHRHRPVQSRRLTSRSFQTRCSRLDTTQIYETAVFLMDEMADKFPNLAGERDGVRDKPVKENHDNG